MEQISPRSFNALDRQRVHDEAVESARAHTERHLAQYTTLATSFAGRYVSADLFKETFAAFAHSPEARNRYNAPTHNAASVLASEHLRRLLGQPVDVDAQRVALLTGMPGAGKTRTVLINGVFPPGVAAIYEGQLANPVTAFQKIDQVLASGRQVAIVAAHPLPEEALRNTLHRFAHEGRGAGIGVMADIAGKLPDSLQAVRDRYADQVQLQVYDLRARASPIKLQGWNHLDVLRSEGNRNDIDNRLRHELERQRTSGTLTVEAFRQAHGAAPLGPYRGMAGQSERGPSADVDRPELSPADRAADRARSFAHATRSTAVAKFPDLHTSFEALERTANLAKSQGMPIQQQHAVLCAVQDQIHADLEKGIVHQLRDLDRAPDDRSR